MLSHNLVTACSPAFPVFKLEEYFEPREFKARYLFSSSDPEAWSLGEILAMADDEARERWHSLSLGYTEARGLTLLRESIVEQHYPSLNKERILVCAGAEEGIFLAMASLLNADDHAIVVTPCYQSLLTLPAQRCAIDTIALNESENWQLNLNQVRDAILPNTKLVVVNFPHNPTGTTLPLNTFNELVALVRRHGIYLFFDEVYRLLALDPADELPPVASVYERGISLSVMSKAYGLPGLRIGWLACQDQSLIEACLQLKYYTTICNSAPSELLALMALKQQVAILKRNHKLMQGNLRLLDQVFQTHAEQLSWVRPKGGCTGFARLKTGEAINMFADRLLEAQSMMILPGDVYDWPGDYFRIGYGRRNMPEVLDRFILELKR